MQNKMKLMYLVVIGLVFFCNFISAVSLQRLKQKLTRVNNNQNTLSQMVSQETVLKVLRGKSLHAKPVLVETKANVADKMGGKVVKAQLAEEEDLTIEALNKMTKVDLDAYIANRMAKLETKALCSERVIRCANGQPLRNINYPVVNGCGPEMTSFPAVQKIINTLANGMTPFEDCCNTHDMCYGGWGSDLSTTRKECDVDFHHCMKKKAEDSLLYKFVAFSFYEGVRNVGCSAFYEARIYSNCVNGEGA